MKENQDFQQDLASIRNLMERSSKFISLSGLSGILAGIYSLIGAAYAYFILNNRQYTDLPANDTSNPNLIFDLGVPAVIVLLATLFTGWYFSVRKAKKAATSFWNATSKALVINLSIPLLTGGIFVVILLAREYYEIIVSCFLLFYGLALVNASANLFDEVRYLGYLEIGLGLVAAFLPELGLLLWALGFGVLHIIYGSWMYRRYDRT